MEIRCVSCNRVTTVEKRETTQRLARRRWMVAEDVNGVYVVVCGGNDGGVFQQVGLSAKEVDSCLSRYVADFKVTLRTCHVFIPDLGTSPPVLERALETPINGSD